MKEHSKKPHTHARTCTRTHAREAYFLTRLKMGSCCSVYSSSPVKNSCASATSVASDMAVCSKVHKCVCVCKSIYVWVWVCGFKLVVCRLSCRLRSTPQPLQKNRAKWLVYLGPSPPETHRRHTPAAAGPVRLWAAMGTAAGARRPAWAAAGQRGGDRRPAPQWRPGAAQPGRRAHAARARTAWFCRPMPRPRPCVWNGEGGPSCGGRASVRLGRQLQEAVPQLTVTVHSGAKDTATRRVRVRFPPHPSSPTYRSAPGRKCASASTSAAKTAQCSGGAVDFRCSSRASLFRCGVRSTEQGSAHHRCR